MTDFASIESFVIAIIAAIIVDLFIRGIWRFIDMTPIDKVQNISGVKTIFMIAFPISFVSMMTAFILPESLKYLAGGLLIVSAFSLVIAVSMISDAFKYIRKLENTIKKLANKNSNKNTK